MEEIDPRAVLGHLNALGYTGVDARELKDFVKDLKKIVKFETGKIIESKRAPENKENRPTARHIAVHIYDKRRHDRVKQPALTNFDTVDRAPFKNLDTVDSSAGAKAPSRPSSKTSLPKLNKSDPVALYHFYQSEWKRAKIPGQERRAELRWAVRARMLSGPKVEVKAKTSLTTRSAWSSCFPNLQKVMAINEAEAKLARYRAKKQREALFERAKAALWGPKTAEKKEDAMSVEKEERSAVVPLLDDDEEKEEASPGLTALDYVHYVLCFALWATLYAIFIKLEFGTVYLIVSMLLGVCYSTGTGKKKKNAPSAYSVFNKDCRRLPGTLDAEQMTRQMLYGR